MNDFLTFCVSIKKKTVAKLAKLSSKSGCGLDTLLPSTFLIQYQFSLLPLPICLEPNAMWSVDFHFKPLTRHNLTPTVSVTALLQVHPLFFLFLSSPLYLCLLPLLLLYLC